MALAELPKGLSTQVKTQTEVEQNMQHDAAGLIYIMDCFPAQTRIMMSENTLSVSVLYSLSSQPTSPIDVRICDDEWRDEKISWLERHVLSDSISSR